MKNVEYLVIQLENLVDDLNEEIRSCANMVTVAYMQGKKDAYNAVLCAIRESEDKECKLE